MTEQYYQKDHLIDLVTKVLVANNTSEANARTVADALVQAQIDGQYGHGLSRIPSYSGQAKVGKVDGHATPSIEEAGSAAFRVDAKCGFAYPAMALATEKLLEKVKTSGIAAATVYNSHHFGIAGYHTEKLANEGMVGILVTNSPKAIAPWGGISGVFGTNPIAFAAPRKDTAPLVIDLSLSKIARGKVMVASQEGRPIPDDWALDVEGKPTTDADAALAGTMLPMGDAKGAALVLMVEILAAAVSGAQFGFEASSLFNSDGPPPRLGHTYIALNPELLSGGGFVERLEVLLEAITTQPNVRLPGQRRLDGRAMANEKGISVPDNLYEKVTAMLPDAA